MKIGDIGVAKAMQEGLPLGQSVFGTPEFMAPELYRGTYDEKVDIYAYGMCLLELATMKLPYSECETRAKIFEQVTMGIYPASLSEIKNTEIKEFIELCINHSRDKRPHARQLLQHPFFNDVRPRSASGTFSPISTGGSTQSIDIGASRASPDVSSQDVGTALLKRQSSAPLLLESARASTNGQIREEPTEVLMKQIPSSPLPLEGMERQTSVPLPAKHPSERGKMKKQSVTFQLGQGSTGLTISEKQTGDAQQIQRNSSGHHRKQKHNSGSLRAHKHNSGEALVHRKSSSPLPHSHQKQGLIQLQRKSGTQLPTRSGKTFSLHQKGLQGLQMKLELRMAVQGGKSRRLKFPFQLGVDDVNAVALELKEEFMLSPSETQEFAILLKEQIDSAKLISREASEKASFGTITVESKDLQGIDSTEVAPKTPMKDDNDDDRMAALREIGRMEVVAPTPVTPQKKESYKILELEGDAENVKAQTAPIEDENDPASEDAHPSKKRTLSWPTIRVENYQECQQVAIPEDEGAAAPVADASNNNQKYGSDANVAVVGKNPGRKTVFTGSKYWRKKPVETPTQNNKGNAPSSTNNEKAEKTEDSTTNVSEQKSPIHGSEHGTHRRDEPSASKNNGGIEHPDREIARASGGGRWLKWLRRKSSHNVEKELKESKDGSHHSGFVRIGRKLRKLFRSKKG